MSKRNEYEAAAMLLDMKYDAHDHTFNKHVVRPSVGANVDSFDADTLEFVYSTKDRQWSELWEARIDKVKRS